MTVRVVLTAVLLVAVGAVALPAVEDGRTERTARVLDDNAQRLVDTAGLLVDREDATAPGVPGARRIVSLTLPERSIAARGVTRFAVRGGPNRTDRVTYQLVDEHRRQIASPVALRPRNGTVVLRRAGKHRLRLKLTRVGRPVVTVTRLSPGAKS